MRLCEEDGSLRVDGGPRITEKFGEFLEQYPFKGRNNRGERLFYTEIG